MVKNKEELANKITALCKNNIGKRSVLTKITHDVLERFGLPEGISSDILTLRTDAIDYDDKILFYMFYCLLYEHYSHCEQEVKNKIINETLISFFSQKEIDEYLNSKYRKSSYHLPIKWKVIPVAEDQWICSISVRELMQLRDAQLINYNENAQRTLRHMVNNGIEYYKIDLNRVAVEQIMQSYTNGSYIPNTLTLNIPEDSEFFYNEDSGELVIKNIKAFDILDGYHRYIALSNLYTLNKKFTYDMELRVVSFGEDKARQFIWQEDQKTKMKKVDSEALNQNNYGNQVVQMLSTKGILNGIVSRNKGNIDYSTLAQLVNLLYFPNKRKVYKRTDLLEARDDIYEKFEYILEELDRSLLDKRWNTKYTAAFMYIISRNDINRSDYLIEINKLYGFLKLPENENVISQRLFNQATITRISKIYERR